MDDSRICRDARQTLTRLRIDTNRLLIRSSRNILSVSGHLQYKFSSEGHSPELGYELLRELDRQLNRIEGVSRAEYSFDNWAHHSEGNWTKKGAKKQLSVRRQSSAPEPEQ